MDGVLVDSAGDFPPTRELVRAGEAREVGASETQAEGGSWELKELKPMHRQVASLLAQGAKRQEIAQLCDITPEYVTMLSKQPLVQAHIAEICAAAGIKMEAMFEKVVDVIGDTLINGSEAGKLKAARLQLEATKRIGRPDPNSGLDRGTEDRLSMLAERLLALQTGVRQGRVFDGNTGREIQESELQQS